MSVAKGANAVCVLCGKPVRVRSKLPGPYFAVCHDCGVKEFNKPIR